MTALRRMTGRAGRYVTVGLATNGALYLLFLALVWGGMRPVLASGLCYILGVAASYLLNRRWTFRSRAGHGRDLPRFLAAYGAGLAVTLVLMGGPLVGLLGPALAQIVTIVASAATIFGMLNLLRFGAER